MVISKYIFGKNVVLDLNLLLLFYTNDVEVIIHIHISLFDFLCNNFLLRFVLYMLILLVLIFGNHELKCLLLLLCLSLNHSLFSRFQKRCGFLLLGNIVLNHRDILKRRQMFFLAICHLYLIFQYHLCLG
jgi:hypothetical protein